MKEKVNPLVNLNAVGDIEITPEKIVNSNKVFSYFPSNNGESAMIDLISPFDDAIATEKTLGNLIDNIITDESLYMNNLDTYNYHLAEELYRRLEDVVRHNKSYVYYNGFKKLIDPYVNKDLGVNAFGIAEPEIYSRFAVNDCLYSTMFKQFKPNNVIEPSQVPVVDLAQTMYSNILGTLILMYSTWYSTLINNIIDNRLIDLDRLGNDIYKSDYNEELEDVKRFPFAVSVLSEQANNDMELLRGIISTNVMQTVSEYISFYKYPSDAYAKFKGKYMSSLPENPNLPNLKPKKITHNKYSSLPANENVPQIIVRQVPVDKLQDAVMGNIDKEDFPIVKSFNSIKDLQKALKNHEINDNELIEF